jgi:hypothetical protein
VKCVNIVMYRIIIMLVEGKFLIMMRSCTNSMFTYHKLIINSVIEDNWFVIHWAGAALRRSTLLYSLSGGCKVSSMSSSIS